MASPSSSSSSSGGAAADVVKGCDAAAWEACKAACGKLLDRCECPDGKPTAAGARCYDAPAAPGGGGGAALIGGAVGGAVGGLLLLICCIVLIVVLLRRGGGAAGAVESFKESARVGYSGRQMGARRRGGTNRSMRGGDSTRGAEDDSVPPPVKTRSRGPSLAQQLEQGGDAARDSYFDLPS